MKDSSVRPETMSQAITWERTKRLYLADGLCEPCAMQAAWGHQLCFHFRSSREKWPEADRIIKPPCAQCAPVVATFPVEVRNSPWRRWPQGDRRPVSVPVQNSDQGDSAPRSSRMADDLTLVLA